MSTWSIPAYGVACLFGGWLSGYFAGWAGTPVLYGMLAIAVGAVIGAIGGRLLFGGAR